MDSLKMSEILKLEKRRKNLVLKFAAYITVSAILIYWFLRFCVYFYTISKEELDFTSDNNIMFYVITYIIHLLIKSLLAGRKKEKLA